MSERPNLIFLCKAQFKWIQHCWSTTPNIVGCYLLLHVAGSCCAKLETGQSFEPTTPNISFVLSADQWSEMQQCWIHLHSSFNIVGAMHTHYHVMVSKVVRVASFSRWTACPNVAACICTPLPTRTQQLATLLAQQC